MDTRRSLFRNTISISVGHILALFIGVITHAFWARAIGPEHYGILGFTATIVSYFGIAAALGTVIWGTRSVARNTLEVTARVSEVVSLRLVLSVLSFLVFVVLLSIWRPLNANLIV